MQNGTYLLGLVHTELGKACEWRDDGAADAKVWHIAAREGSSAARVRQIEYEAAMCAFDGLVEAPSNLARLRHRVRCEP